ncbi:rho GTPase-activating protein 18-like [Microcaecilia unicolor]|uniref:Rho GTPase-activating protein 18 n=1 Tax=Microcaecilia unicolor TaxID=1415580 RepID=A0A6P7XB61_9AMPH|nr:rho GTPase-activating protein 18-like [Microcaecilia unicolor]
MGLHYQSALSLSVIPVGGTLAFFCVIKDFLLLLAVTRRSGQCTVNQKNSPQTGKKPPFDRSSSQDSLDDLSLDDYWTELENIEKSTDRSHEEREEVVKEPDEGELEEEWLKEAGLSNLFAECAGDSQESMVFLSTLTRTQSAAVQKRIDTMRRKSKHHHAPDVRDVFKQKTDDTTEKVSDLNGLLTPEMSEINAKQKGTADGQNLSCGDLETSSPTGDVSAPETDINLEISFAEQAAILRDTTKGKVLKSREDDSLLPNYRVPKDKTGTTKIGNLAPQDMKKVCYLALIELAALYDVLGVELKHQKALKAKVKESGLFGVSLQILLEQDQKKVPGTRVPLIFQKLIFHIEGKGLETEGLLRIPGGAMRIKSLCQELETKFYEGLFNWDSVKQHDAASLLKLFVRELPQPLLTIEYLKAFQSVCNLPTKKHQLQALNLLVLLLPDSNRDTLKALLEFLQRVIDCREKNKMTRRNVSMVMAPNLFTFHGFRSKTVEQNEALMAAGTASVMLLMIKYQKLLWTIPKFIIDQVRKQNLENQKKLSKDRAMKKLLKKMAYDREKHDKQEKTINEVDVAQGVIRVQAPHLSKTSMVIQLTEELKASDVLARFLSQESGTAQNLKSEEVCLYEVGGNIGERCLEDETYMKDLSQLNPNAEWVIKPKSC